MGTLTEADRPSGSLAVTVTSVAPTASASAATTLPSTDTETTDEFPLVAAKVSASPSGSLKNGAASTRTVSPTVAVCAGATGTAAPGATGTAATGARLGSVTVTLALAAVESPAGSRAVAVTVVVPAATAAMVRLAPDTDAVATPGLDEIAV